MAHVNPDSVTSTGAIHQQLGPTSEVSVTAKQRPSLLRMASDVQSHGSSISSQQEASTLSNPFSPPGSVVNITVPDLRRPSSFRLRPQHTHALSSDSILTIPRSGVKSSSTGGRDLPQGSFPFYGSRPSTADNSPDFQSTRFRESFASPRPRPLTLSSTVQLTSAKLLKERPKSTMLSAKGPIEKPWTEKRDPYTRISYFITYGLMLLGIAGGAIRCWLSYKNTPVLPSNLCMVMDEGFDSADGVFGANGKFFREVDMSGFGNGEFEMTTASENNSYVKDGRLYITPTLTQDSIGPDAILDGVVYNITGCTFNITQGWTYTSSATTNNNLNLPFNADGYYRACSAVSNATSGQIINPVQSARISTRNSANIKYGRVEVRAKIPKGDWFWPAIWMLPVDSKYGPWPLSGEIDIMESRGNGIRYPFQGSNVVRGSLNWGVTPALNRVWKTYGWWPLRRTSYADDFHTYALEWTEDFIRIYVDSRLHHLLDLKIKKSFWDRGEFPLAIRNGSDTLPLNNPWQDGTKAAPFDQPFYLILNLAVGGTNGWFPDDSEKPWLDGSNTAMLDFWRARDKWLPTWPKDVEDRSLVVDSVKMWQVC